MSDTKISWAGKTWNPITGCSPISPGCANCYAARMAQRLAGRFWYPKDDPFAVTFHPDKLNEPLKWKKPRMVFVCSMGDLFHANVSEFLYNDIFGAMRDAPQHIFLLLTKRPNKMKSVLYNVLDLWPLPNVWLGVTAENQEMADERIPVMLSIPAAKHFISVEPMLGPVFFAHYGGADAKIDWVICGGETGLGARPIYPNWLRSLRVQCAENNTPFHFKSWGQWFPRSQWEGNPDLFLPNDEQCISDKNTVDIGDGEYQDFYHNVGSKRSGRNLDGVEWGEFPEVLGA